MNPKTRALLWEQGRVAGVLTLWCLGLVLLSFLFFRWGHGFRDLYMYRDFLIFWLYAPQAGLALLFLLRLNVSGHLDFRFEARLARLPVSTAMLTFIPLLTRVACLMAHFAGISLISWSFYGQFLSPMALVLTIMAYLVLQALVWTEKSAVYLALIPLAASPLVFILLRALGLLPRFRFAERAIATQTQTVVVIVCLALLPGILGLAWLGVTWERRNEHHRLFSLDRLRAWFERHQPFLKQAFMSQEEARYWFERMNSGAKLMRIMSILLIVGVPAVIVCVLLWNALAPVRSYYASAFRLDFLLFRMGPYGAVVFTALFMGAIREFSRSMWPLPLGEFTTTRPVSDARLAWIHLLLMTRRFMFCLLGAFALSNVLHWWFIPEHYMFMVQQLLSGPDRLLPLAYFLAPLFWAGILVWLALWCVKPLLVFMGLLLLIGRLQIGNAPPDVIALCLFCVFLLVYLGQLFRHAWRENLFSRVGWVVYLAAHLLLALFIWWPGASGYAAGYALVLALLFVALLLSPIIALPKQVMRKRVVN